MKKVNIISFIIIFLFSYVSPLYAFIVDRGSVSSIDTLKYKQSSPDKDNPKHKKPSTPTEAKTRPQKTSTASDSEFQNAIYKLQRQTMLKEKKRLLRQAAEKRQELQKQNFAYKFANRKNSYFNHSKKGPSYLHKHRTLTSEKRKDDLGKMSEVNGIANFFVTITYIILLVAVILFFVKGG